MLPTFRALGDAVAADWHATGGDAARFVAIATARLTERPAHEQTTLADVLDWIATTPTHDLPPQADRLARFGEPPITVYRGRRFRIDVNLWASSTTEIHGHGFAGAFQVLHGASLHAPHAFTIERAISPHLAVGTLSSAPLEVLTAGDVRPIHPGLGSLHALFHLDHPSATVVVRTDGEAAHLPQLTIDPPGVALESTFADSVLSPLERRQAQIAATLGRADAPDREAWLARVLAGADPAFAYHLIANVLPGAWLPPRPPWEAVDLALDRWVAAASWPDDALHDAARVAAGLRVERLIAASARSRLVTREDRLVLGALLCAPTRAAVDALLAAHVPDAPPRKALLRFLNRGLRLRDPADRTWCALGLHEQAADLLTRIVAEDLSFDDLLARLATERGAAWVAANRDALARIDGDLRARLPYATLFR